MRSPNSIPSQNYKFGPLPNTRVPAWPFLISPPLLSIYISSSFFLSLSRVHRFNLSLRSLFSAMVKQGKLTKLLKKMQSFGRHSGNGRTGGGSDSFCSSAACAGDLRPVFVGKSRRRYLISSEVIHHPLFRELAERSSSSKDDDSELDHDAITVRCEVVMFEHLLWMLDNADAEPESLQELVEFYAY
ncbi:hypothetical protein Dimus_002495 [Dionaea muscipula]